MPLLDLFWAIIWFVLFALWLGSMIFFSVQLIRYGAAKGGSTWLLVGFLLVLIWILLPLIGVVVAAIMYYRTIKPELRGDHSAEDASSVLVDQ